jgi:hypothetical protein
VDYSSIYKRVMGLAPDPNDELTVAMTRALLGGQDPSVVEQGQARGLQGPTQISQQKSPYEPTMRPGEFEQMTPEQRKVRLAGQLLNAFMAASSAAPQLAEAMRGPQGPAVRASAGGRKPPSGKPPSGPVDLTAPGALEKFLEGKSADVRTVEPSAKNLPVNASNIGGVGQEGASVEAGNRFKLIPSGVQRLGLAKFAIRDRAGNLRPSTEDGARVLQPGESWGPVQNGVFTPQEER